MRTPVFTGACPALVTPFHQSGSIDFDTFAAQIDRQIQAGVDALCVCGTTGEASTLSVQEQADAVAFCVRQAGGRVKVIAGAGSNNTATALLLAQNAQNAGADAILVVTPYYNKTTQAGLLDHYTKIAQRVDLPVILYNVPSRTGLSFAAETYARLAEIPNINGVKEASGNLSLVTKTRALCPDDFYIWSGNDDQVVPLMALGGKGVISVAANLVPRLMVELSHRCLAGDFAGAAQLQIDRCALIDSLFLEVNPIPIKAAMHLCKLDSGFLRAPLCPISDGNLALLRRALQEAEVL